RLLLVPGMVAAGDDVGAGVDELAVDCLGDAEAAGRVLPVDGDEVELPIANEAWQPVQHDRAPAAAYNVSDEEDEHACQDFRKSMTSRSVSTRSSRASRGVSGMALISCAAKAMPTAAIGFFARSALIVMS